MEYIKYVLNQIAKKLDPINPNEFINKILKKMKMFDNLNSHFDVITKLIKLFDKYRWIIYKEFIKGTLFINIKFNSDLITIKQAIILLAIYYKNNKPINSMIKEIFDADENITNLIKNNNPKYNKKIKIKMIKSHTIEYDLINKNIDTILYKYNIFTREHVKIYYNHYIYYNNKHNMHHYLKYKKDKNKKELSYHEYFENNYKHKKEVDGIIFYKNKFLCLIEVKTNIDDIPTINPTYTNIFNNYYRIRFEIDGIKHYIKFNRIMKNLWILIKFKESNICRFFNFNFNQYFDPYVEFMFMILYCKKYYKDEFINKDFLIDFIKNKKSNSYTHNNIHKYKIICD